MKKLNYILALVFFIAVFSSCNKKPTVKVEEVKDTVKIEGLQHVDWSYNANIYEVNLRQFTKEGNFAAFEKHLPRLKAMGVDILWLMPIHPIGVKNRKGAMGSYYSVQDYKAVNPEFGTMEEFKSLVKKIHELDMKVIIDWVANHTAWDNAWVTDHPEWYTKDSLGNMIAPFDWSDVADLNYDNKALHTAMIDALDFWVAEADIDGYRCDVAELVPVDFWDAARASLDSIKPVFMLAEADVAELHTNAFDMTYAWEFHFLMNEVAQGKKSIKDIDEYFEREKEKYKANDFRMMFTSNHDENSWKGTEFTRLGDAYKTFAVMAATLPGMPLIYNGQEAGMDKMLRFFEKDTISWDSLPMEKFYTEMLDLKHKNKALWNGVKGGEMNRLLTTNDSTIFAFSRVKDENSVIVILNLSDTIQDVVVDAQGLNDEYINQCTKEPEVVFEGIELSMQPWEYLILSK